MHMSGLYAVPMCQVIEHSFDHICELMGVPSALFVDTYPDVIRNMKRSIVEKGRDRSNNPKLLGTSL